MKIKFFLAACVALFFATQSAFAAGAPVGVGGAPPSGPFDGDPSGVDVGSDLAPIEIWLDPEGGPWLKLLDISTPNGIFPGMTIPVWEHIRVVAPPPNLPLLFLTDWHEELHSPNWTWAGGTFTIHNTGTTVPGLLGGPQGANTDIWFEFPPHLPLPGAPLDLWIHKDLQYNGPPDQQVTSVVIEIWEFPTVVPEPTALLLMIFGSASLLVRYRNVI